MSDIIQLLPDAVANQIAAGEVIQRPASAVKELMENAIDAGATSVKVIIKDAGRTLIQVIDNGCGMSPTDARLSFERHATSKIRKAEDLFAIRTMGFRGEALASIAAVAQVELKTKRVDDEIGTCILIEGSEVVSQEACSCSNGTSIAMKNLFFNIPARRNFLKSNPIEMKHIIDEFQRVALAHPSIAFSLHHNNMEVFHLNSGNHRQRIISVFGSNYNERLVPVKEETTILNIHGFVSKPEFAKKVRGEQYLFINDRFVKDAYINHAVITAFEQMLPAGSYPSYFLYLDIDTHKIDINIHPTKTEIKFDDEKSIYAIVCSAIKRSLGQYSIAPTLDFERESNFDLPLSYKNALPVEPSISFNPEYNPFTEENKKSSSVKQSYSKNDFSAHRNNEQENKQSWQTLYQGLERETEMEQIPDTSIEQGKLVEDENDKLTYQLHNRYILSHIKSGIMIIDQQHAHERILYERYLHSLHSNQCASQQQLFPQTIEFSASDFELVKELKQEIRSLGFDIEEFGKNTFVIHGTPTDLNEASEKAVLEGLIEQFKHFNPDLKLDRTEKLARAMAKQTSIKSGKILKKQEMNMLIDELFACQVPYSTPTGKPTLWVMTLEELAKKFEK